MKDIKDQLIAEQRKRIAMLEAHLAAIEAILTAAFPDSDIGSASS